MKCITLVSFIILHIVSTTIINGNINSVVQLIKLSFTKFKCVCLITDCDLNYSNLIIGSLFEHFQIVIVHIDNTRYLKDSPWKCAGYIILSNTANHINHIFTSSRINQFFEPHKRVLLVTKESTSLKKTEIELATALHDLDLIIIQNTKMESAILWKEDEELFFNTTIPYDVMSSRKPKWHPELLLSKYNRSICVALFNCKPFAFFDEATQSYDGVEIKMLNAILQNWPIRYNFIVNKNSKHLFVEVFTQVNENKCDVGICAQWQQAVHGFDIGKTIEYTRTCQRLIVPRPQLLPNSTFIFHSLHTDFWILYFVTLIISSFVIHITSKIFKTLKSGFEDDILLPFIHMLRIFSLGALTRIPYSTQISVRFLMINLFIFCILASTIYSTGLTILLRFPRFSGNINNIQDVIENNLRWLDYSDWMKNWMLNTGNEKLEKLAYLFDRHTTISQDNKKLRQKSHGAMVQMTPGYYVMFSETLDEYGRSNLKVINENIACFYTVFTMKRNSAFVNIFNKAIFMLIESGLVDYWFGTFVRKRENRYMETFFQQYSQEVHQNIDLEKLQGAFYFLCLGLITATLAFFVEYIHFYNKLHHK
jgi:hypothetical protein